MLEFAKIPGLTKIFNRDDWMKVFLACSTLPDYRESKYSSYFITTDATIRSGKLYYEKNALDKGGYSYDPISHIALTNSADPDLPESLDYSFGPGDKHEFHEFLLAAKCEILSGSTYRRGVTEDTFFNTINNYYYKDSGDSYASMVGGNHIVRGYTGAGDPVVYCNIESWQKWINYEEDGKTPLKGRFTAGWNDSGMKDTFPIYYRKADGTFVKFTSKDGKVNPDKVNTKDRHDEFMNDSAITDKTIYVLYTDKSVTTHFYQVGDLVSDIGFIVYDSEVIGEQTFSTSDQIYYYRKNITGIEATTDVEFKSGRKYFAFLTKTKKFKELVAGTDYNIGDLISGYTAGTVGDEYCSRQYTFDSVMGDSDLTRGGAITSTFLHKYDNHLYTAKLSQSGGASSIVSDVETTLYTIDADYGSLTKVSYLQNGYKLADSVFGTPTDLKFRKTGVYYIKRPGTLELEPGYQILDSSRYAAGQTISTWEELNDTKVYMFNTRFYIADTSVVGAITHGNKWYERAGTNYPYEGFVAVTTAASSNSAMGSLYQCKRKEFGLTEDTIHGYTGDGAEAVSKAYYQYDKDTGVYTKVPSLANPVFRNTSGTSFIQTTSDEFFRPPTFKTYYADIMGKIKLNGGTKEDYDADAPLHLNIQYYYSTSGKDSDGMRVDAYAGSVYDRERPIYYRDYDAYGNGTWKFNLIDPSGRYGLTTDTKWSFKPSDPSTYKDYRFYAGEEYRYTSIQASEHFSVVGDSLFGFEDYNDLYYGYTKLVAGTDYIAGTATASSVVSSTGDDWDNTDIRLENLSTHVLGDKLEPDDVLQADYYNYYLSSDAKYKKDTQYFKKEGSTYVALTAPKDYTVDASLPVPNTTIYERTYVAMRYHIRNYSHVVKDKDASDNHASTYCIYNSASRKVEDEYKQILVAESKIGTYIGRNVYGEYPSTATELTTYYYMSNSTAPKWVDKFSEFPLNFSPTDTTDTTPVPGKKYYKRTDNYVKSMDSVWYPYKSYYTADTTTTPPTYKLFALEECDTGSVWENGIPYWDKVSTDNYTKVDKYVATKDDSWVLSDKGDSLYERSTDTTPDTSKTYYTRTGSGTDSDKYYYLNLFDRDCDDDWYRMWLATKDTSVAVCFKAGVKYYRYSDADPSVKQELTAVDITDPSSATQYHVGEPMGLWLSENCASDPDAYICTPYFNGSKWSSTLTFVNDFRVDVEIDGIIRAFEGYFDLGKREKPYFKKEGGTYVKVDWKDYNKTDPDVTPLRKGLYQHARVSSIIIGENTYTFGGMDPHSLHLYTPNYSGRTDEPRLVPGIYELGDSVYTEQTVAATENPKELGLYEFESYYGRLINSQQKTIYRKGDNGTIPTEYPVCVPYMGELTPEPADIDSFRDGEELPSTPSLFVESLLGESILPDEYYEECYGLYYWDQFFLDHGISCTPVTGVRAFMTGEKTDPGMLYMTWTDPTVMIKEGEATATPDAWTKTTVELYDPTYTSGTNKWTILVSTSCSAYKDIPAQLNLSKLTTVAYEMDKGSVVRNTTVPDPYVRLANGYLIITAISASGTKAVYNIKASKVVWTKSSSPRLVNIATGKFIDSDMTSTQPLLGLAIPGVKYIDTETGDTATNVFERVTSVELGTKHKLVYSKDYPITKVRFTDSSHTAIVSYTPIIVGETVTEGTTITLPAVTDDTALCTLATPEPEITIQQLIADGFGPYLFDVGSEVVIPTPSAIKPTTGTESTSINKATVVDFDSVRLKRNVEMGYKVPEDDYTIAGHKYYVRVATTSIESVEPTGSTHNYKYAEVHVPAGTACSGGTTFFVHGDKPHYQYYTRTNKSPTYLDDATFTPIDYGVSGWDKIVLDPGNQIYYRDPTLTRGGYYEYIDDVHSVSFKVTEPIVNTAFDAGATVPSTRLPSACWRDSTIRQLLNTSEYVKITGHTELPTKGRTYYAYNKPLNKYLAFSTSSVPTGTLVGNFFDGSGTTSDPYRFKEIGGEFQLSIEYNGVTYEGYYRFEGYLGGNKESDDFYQAIRPVLNRMICRKINVADQYMLTTDAVFMGAGVYFSRSGSGEDESDPYIYTRVTVTPSMIGSVIPANTFQEPVRTSDTHYIQGKTYIQKDESFTVDTFKQLFEDVDWTAGDEILDTDLICEEAVPTPDVRYRAEDTYYVLDSSGTTYVALVKDTDYYIGDPIPPETVYVKRKMPVTTYVLTTDLEFAGDKTYYQRTGDGSAEYPYVYTRLIAGTSAEVLAGKADYVVGDAIPADSIFEASYHYVHNELVTDKLWIPSLNQVGIGSMTSPDSSVYIGSFPTQSEDNVLAAFSYEAYSRARAKYPEDTANPVHAVKGSDWWRLNPRIMPRVGTAVTYYTRTSVDYDINKPGVAGEPTFDRYVAAVTPTGGEIAELVNAAKPPKIFVYFTIA